MDYRKELERYKSERDYIESKKLHLIELIEQSQKITTVLGHVHIASQVTDRMAETVAKIVDMQTEILDNIYAQEKFLNIILKTINELDGKYKLILYKEYVEGKNLTQVAAEIGYEYNYVKRIKGIALNQYRNIRKNNNRY